MTRATEQLTDAGFASLGRARLSYLLQYHTQGLDEAELDALFIELRKWIRKADRAHRQMARSSGKILPVGFRNARIEAAFLEKEFGPTYQPHSRSQFQATPSRSGNAMRQGSSLHSENDDRLHRAKSDLDAALTRLRILEELDDARSQTREGPQAQSQRVRREADQRLQTAGIPSTRLSVLPQSDGNYQFAWAYLPDRGYRFFRIDLSENPELAHRLRDDGNHTPSGNGSETEA